MKRTILVVVTLLFCLAFTGCFGLAHALLSPSPPPASSGSAPNPPPSNQREGQFLGWDFQFNERELNAGVRSGKYKLGPVVNNVGRRTVNQPSRNGQRGRNQKEETYLIDPSKPEKYRAVYAGTSSTPPRRR